MKKRAVYLSILVAAVIIWVIGFGCFPLLVYSPLNCSYEDVDIHSGRIRYQRYLLGFCISSSIEDTELSRILSDAKSTERPDWHRVNTFSPLCGYSPNHRYHGAISEIRLSESFWGVFEFTAEAKRQMAADILTLWQAGNGDHPVSLYMNQLESTVKRQMDVKDLPTIEALQRKLREQRPMCDGR